jgi:uncharacterized membrane protein
MYLGCIKRGIIILIFGFIIAIASSFLHQYLLGTIIIIGYGIWQIYDAYKHYKKLNAGETKVAQ